MSKIFKPPTPPASLRIAIVGGGIAGLSAAFYLEKRSKASAASSPLITLLDAADRVGGVLGTTLQSGYLVEQSADNFIINEQMPWAQRLADDMGFDELLAPEQEHRTALILKGSRAYSVPIGFQLTAASRIAPILTTRLLGLAGKLRLLAEPFVTGIGSAAGEANDDVSLETFARHRVGKEAFERLVQPLVSGIFSADPAKLSMQAALPQYIDMVRRHGSLTKGLRSQELRGSARGAAGARYAMFRAPRGGMQSFVDHLVGELRFVKIRLESKVESIRRDENGPWQVTGKDFSQPFDHVIVALPAVAAATMLRDENRQLSDELQSIERAGVAVVCLGYRRDQIRHPLDAFGLVVPDVEQRPSIAISFGSNKFPGRAPAGHVLLRVFLGGALRPEIVSLPRPKLEQIAKREVELLLGSTGSPQLVVTRRWHQVTPQYYVGHLGRIERIEKALAKSPGLALAGNSYRGIGVPQCIRSGFEAAANVLRC